MTTAIQEYSVTDAALADLAQRYKSVVFQVATTDGMKTAIKARAELRTYRVDLEKKRVEIKAPALERCRLIDAEAKRITVELEALEIPIDAQIKAEEKRKEDEKLAQEKAEAARIERTHAAIRDIRDALIDVAGRDSRAIAEQIKVLVGLECTVAEFQEFQGAAIIARDSTLETLRKMHTAALAQDAESARLKAEREELTRLRAEQAERERVERERNAAETLRRQQEDAARRREIEAQEQAARDRIAATEREAQARQDAELKRIREEQNFLAAQRREQDERTRQEREAIEAKARAEREAEEERQRQERFAQEKHEREERESERLVMEEREARQREEQRKAQETLDVREALAKLRERAEPFEEFAWFVKGYDAVTALRNRKARNPKSKRAEQQPA